MLFNSLAYFLFLPAVFLLYWFVCGRSLRIQNVLILVASYFFYGWWSWAFMGLLMLSTLMDYGYAFGVASENRRLAKVFLWLSIINNLGILGAFKYYDFFATEFAAGLALLGFEANPVLLKVMLPVGISFYTFHGMSYVFDIYRGRLKPVVNFVDYAVFVSFFPLLVAGPIERATHLLPQIQLPRLFNRQQAVAGSRLILWGLFKKVVIADSLAPLVDQTFANPTGMDTISLLAGALAFSIQIYGDFSGYSDIALGTAKLFGFELLSNFRFPYFSRDIAEFWRRWHISLSSWFRDYLYIPLGGSQSGRAKAVRNTFVVFLVSGFWHGANWTFLVWGLLHACAFLPLLLTHRNRRYVSDVVAAERILPDARELFHMLSTFLFVTLAWIFFRAESLGDALQYLQSLATNGTNGQRMDEWWKIPMLSAVLIFSDWYLRKDERMLKTPATHWLRYALYIIAAVAIIYQMLMADQSTFIYFQF
ncbi:MAG: MBOAT family O-acyltransferase [Bacteroidia bacterium]